VLGWQGAELKVRLCAPPVDGEANATLVKFLAKSLGLRKAQVTLSSGAGSRHKIVEIQGADSAQIMERLKEHGIKSPNR
jgi:uncharacterized protein (TIGR00251 family)